MSGEGPVYKLQEQAGKWQLLTTLSSMEQAAEVLRSLGSNAGFTEVTVEVYDAKTNNFVAKDKISVGTDISKDDDGDTDEVEGWRRIARGYRELSEKTQQTIAGVLIVCGIATLSWLYSATKLAFSVAAVFLGASEAPRRVASQQPPAVSEPPVRAPQAPHANPAPTPRAAERQLTPPPPPPPATGKTFKYETEVGYTAKILTDPVIRRELAANAGTGRVEFQEFRIYSRDMSEYEQGGRALALNDGSMSPATQITCRLSASKSDVFARQMKFGLTVLGGTIKSYDRSGGLVLDPCDYTEK